VRERGRGGNESVFKVEVAGGRRDEERAMGAERWVEKAENG